jgi:malonyl CoA-acyl carrier protein transacylase
MTADIQLQAELEYNEQQRKAKAEQAETERLKPPIGIMPRYVWDEKRAMELLAAIRRYVDAGLMPKKEWVHELCDLTTARRERGHEPG